MTNTWKLSIKPGSNKGYDPFDKCKQKSLLGLGWSDAYVATHPTNIEQAKNLVSSWPEWKKWPYQLKYFLEDLKKGDHVWIHQKGKYFLCKVENDIIIYGRDIDPEYHNLDLGHARQATWVEVPDKFVSGAIQRGIIAQRTMQPITITEKEWDYNEIIFSELIRNQTWEPKIDESKLQEAFKKLTIKELFSIMSPDDVEDIVSAYLQSKGWILIKSTCFRSKPTFEFSMLNNEGGLGHVQVKSGNADPLMPLKYKQYASNKTSVFLFSTHDQPYTGEQVDNVYPIQQAEIFDWVIKNTWGLTMPLKYRLWIFLMGNIAY